MHGEAAFQDFTKVSGPLIQLEGKVKAICDLLMDVVKRSGFDVWG